MFDSPTWTARGLIFLLVVAARAIGADDAAPRSGPEVAASHDGIDFSKTIRPILSNNCFKCHGPDAEERESGLRLDVRESALAPADSGRPAIVPGKPDQSGLVGRIFSKRKGVMMPPPDSNKTLSETDKALLKAWIEQGADYRTHWAFTAPTRPALPAVRDSSWPRNPIDRFILARLDAEGLRPTAEADRPTLIRRLSLDLTGLPPTPKEIDAFVDDPDPRAYENLVDRLLSSPHSGERMALDWLDAARYADTHGFHIDSGRDMTRWRAWVIDAFNRNLPFNEFTVKQIAGDLLPNATVEDRIASGFNRNHMINFEGGAIPEEYHTAYIVDRVNTTGTVWMGMAVGCAQCHDHKFDPITQKDYYRLYAFFHNVPEQGLDGSKGNAAPVLKVPTATQRHELARLETTVADAQKKYDDALPEIDAAQGKWEKSAAASLVKWTPVTPSEATSKGGATLTKLEDQSILASDQNPATDNYTLVAQSTLERITAVRLETLADDRLPQKGPGRSENGNFVLTSVNVAVEAQNEQPSPIKLKTASADFSQDGFSASRAIDDDPQTGWAINPEVGKSHSIVFVFDQPLTIKLGDSLRFTFEFQSQFAQHQPGRIRVSVTDVTEPLSESFTKPIREILALASDTRNEAQKAELRKYFRANHSPQFKALNDQLASARRARDELDKQIPTTMVMQEMAQPRDTFMLLRGQYDKKGEKVAPGVPDFLSPLPAGAPGNRLGLARWLIDPSHPLTARVAVNRYWQMIFGTGLVKTSEDLGTQGELPSHPELLDWLAVEFVSPTQGPEPRQAWDVKNLVRLFVTSSTYRQASVVTPDRVAKDPENRLLARGPRYRLPAEFIRDLALSVSGLLKDSIGGRSVSPYQPPGLWEELMSREDGKNWSAQTYVQDHGDDLYRRSMYTFWKRTSPPPSLATFDAPDRETCTVRRGRTNTPLQALVLMNDPTYIEASRKFAERVLKEANTTDDRIALAFRAATARTPSDAERAVLTQLLEEQRSVFRKDVPAALKLLKVGESPRDESLDPAELAAWTMITSAILNLDETVTKG
jgi:hypothetical protein